MQTDQFRFPLLRSRMAVQQASDGPPALPITPAAELYTTAQEVRWLEGSRFAVGRWDGSATIYELNSAQPASITITGALAEQDSGGVRMIAPLLDGRCASSNGPACINVWRQDDPTSTIVHLTYEKALTSATAGLCISVEGQRYLIVGHDSGFLSTWKVSPYAIDLHTVLDLRSATTANPWNLQTIYGLDVAPANRIVTAADSGDLCVVDPVSSKLMSRTRFDSGATRGLNDVATLRDYVLTVNCAVGPTQPNLWLFKILPDSSIQHLDAIILRQDNSLPQVFAFCVRFTQDADGPLFLVATEEGLLWVGRILGDKLSILGKISVASHYGAALASRNGQIVVAGDAIHVYSVS